MLDRLESLALKSGELGIAQVLGEDSDSVDGILSSVGVLCIGGESHLNEDGQQLVDHELISGLFALVNELNEEVEGGLGLSLGHFSVLYEDSFVVVNSALLHEVSHAALVDSHDDVESFSDVSGCSTDLAEVSLNLGEILFVYLSRLMLLLKKLDLLVLHLLNHDETLVHHLTEGGQLGLRGKQLSLPSLLSRVKAVPQLLVEEFELFSVLLLVVCQDLHGKVVVHLVEQSQVAIVSRDTVLQGLHGGLANLSGKEAHMLEKDRHNLWSVGGKVSTHGLCDLQDVLESIQLGLEFRYVAVDLDLVLHTKDLEIEASLSLVALSSLLSLSELLEVDFCLELSIFQNDLQVLWSNMVEVLLQVESDLSDGIFDGMLLRVVTTKVSRQHEAEELLSDLLNSLLELLLVLDSGDDYSHRFDSPSPEVPLLRACRLDTI